MEDVVAVRVTLVGGGVRFFMTWGPREAPYFYEGLLHFAWERPAYGAGCEEWRAAKVSETRDGKDLYFLG